MKCEICGKEIEKSTYGSLAVLCDNDECFQKWFWKNLVNTQNNYIIKDHKCYHIKDEKSRDFFRGFGGTKFEINMIDGGTLITTNLWFVGEVPEELRDDLPDNAISIKRM